MGKLLLLGQGSAVWSGGEPGLASSEKTLFLQLRGSTGTLPVHPHHLCAATVTWGGLVPNQCPQVLISQISLKDNFSAKPSTVMLENHPAPLPHCISYFKECDFSQRSLLFYLSDILEGFYSHKN